MCPTRVVDPHVADDAEIDGCGADAQALTEVIDLMLEIKGAWDAMPDEIRKASGDALAASEGAL